MEAYMPNRHDRAASLDRVSQRGGAAQRSRRKKTAGKAPVEAVPAIVESMGLREPYYLYRSLLNASRLPSWALEDAQTIPGGYGVGTEPSTKPCGERR